MSPFWKPPTDERGVMIDAGFYSVEGDLFDRSTPTPGQLDYMVQHDSQVQALDLAISLILQGAPLNIVPAKGDKGEAEFVRSALFDPPQAGGMTTPMSDVVAQMDDAVSRKRVYFEKVWKYRKDDGKAVYHKLAWRPPWQCTVKVDPKNGSFDGFRQQASALQSDPIDEHFKPNKAFVYIFRSYKRPLEGYSAFQTAFGDYVDKLKVNRLHNIHLEKFALGTVIGTYSGRLTGAARKFFDKLKGWIGGGGVMVLGDSETVEVKQHTGAGEEFLDKLRYLDAQMAGSVMLGFLRLAQEGNSGAWALSKDHSDFFVKLMESILQDKANALTAHVIAPLVEVNYGMDAAFPTAEFHEISESHAEYAAEVWKTLVTAANKPGGAFWAAIEQKAAQRMGIDLSELEDSEAEDEDIPGLPTSGEMDVFEKIVKEVAANAGSGGQANGNGNGNGSATSNGSGSAGAGTKET